MAEKILRSDENIREEVTQRLWKAARVDAADIEIKVKGGIVTLTGAVAAERIRRAAEVLTATLPGVLRVKNELTVQKDQAVISEQSLQNNQSSKSIEDADIPPRTSDIM